MTEYTSTADFRVALGYVLAASMYQEAFERHAECLRRAILWSNWQRFGP